MELSLVAMVVIFAPLLGGLLAGLSALCWEKLNHKLIATITTLLMLVAFTGACYILGYFIFDINLIKKININWFTWITIDNANLSIGLWLDELTAIMFFMVTAISLVVHIYSIGYMHGDPGYKRFFSYISLFTFAMLMLTGANNLLQLFFGWEAVGLMSYLLIGFWFKRNAAVVAGLKAFLINRFGDAAFLLGIAGVWHLLGDLNYTTIFSKYTELAKTANLLWQVLPGITGEPIIIITSLLFIGVMSKSAQVPLHVWLPDSMEGPTPISALIHAATMVTAGIFFVARLSPLFELAPKVLAIIALIGAITAFLMALMALIENDIKRIIAYSTLSQLGYMVVALGVSAYTVSIFHLINHAFYKTLLFLSAGSVILAMQHQQNIQRMGGLKRYMPITYLAMLIGCLSAVGIPGTTGFYSKELILAIAKQVKILGKFGNTSIIYILLMVTIFITAIYTFRLFFLVFHTKERMDLPTKRNLKESSGMITWPLIILMIPTMIFGGLMLKLLITSNWLEQALYINKVHQAFLAAGIMHNNITGMFLHGFLTLPFYLTLAGIFVAWYCFVYYNKNKSNSLNYLFTLIKLIFTPIYYILTKKYGFDLLNQFVILPCVRGLGWLCWKLGDTELIEGIIINGPINLFDRSARVLRKIQTGYIYHYAFIMLNGVFILLVCLAW